MLLQVFLRKSQISLDFFVVFSYSCNVLFINILYKEVHLRQKPISRIQELPQSRLMMTVKNPLRRAGPKVRRFHGRLMANSLSTRNFQAYCLPYL